MAPRSEFPADAKGKALLSLNAHSIPIFTYKCPLGRRFRIHRDEDRADRRDSAARERSDKDRPPVPREERVREILSQRVRINYTDRNRQYSLRDSEIHTLGEVGKFRVVGMNDLSEFAYNGDRSRMENDVQSLTRQGLLHETTIADPEHNPTQVVTLAKEGRQAPQARAGIPGASASPHTYFSPSPTLPVNRVSPCIDWPSNRRIARAETKAFGLLGRRNPRARNSVRGTVRFSENPKQSARRSNESASG